jgi:hypothetical protein
MSTWRFVKKDRKLGFVSAALIYYLQIILILPFPKVFGENGRMIGRREVPKKEPPICVDN